MTTLNAVASVAPVASVAAVSFPVMKAESHFKKVSKDSKVAKPEQLGQKRESITWNYQGVSAETLPSLDAGQVAQVLSRFVEDYGRKLIAANGTDWSFVPSADQVSFASAYQDLVTERTRTSVLSKESLAAFGECYAELAVRYLGIPAQSANLGKSLIAEKFARIAGKLDVLEAMRARLAKLAEIEDAAALEILGEHLDVIEALDKLLADLIAAQDISVDAI